MRNSFINALFERAQRDSSIHLVVGDLGYSVVEPFQEMLPTQFLNSGVAEQNMTGLAAGLSMIGGRTVFTYSIANFPTLRCLEQVRNDICHHRANVKIVSVGGGVAYGAHGYSHFASEDLSILRALPGLVAAAPADPVEAKAMLRLACENPGPWYIRLGKNNESTLHETDLAGLSIGQSIEISSGDQGTVLATGTVVGEALAAVRQLAREGVRLRMISMPFVKPIDVEAINRAARETPFLVTVEENVGSGGFGSAVVEALCAGSAIPRLIRLFLPDSLNEVGSQDYLRARYSLDAKGIAERIRREFLS